jgi:hypothetical protein
VAGNLAAGATAEGGGIACAANDIEVGSVGVAEDSSIAGNEASATGPAIAARGGGIYADFCGLGINHAAIDGNAARVDSDASGDASGGGLYDANGTLWVFDSRWTGNLAMGGASASGGAMTVGSSLDEQPALVHRSLLARNEARADGGDVAGGAIAFLGDRLEIVNSTVSDNRVAGASARGGGVAAVSSFDFRAGLDLYSTTVVGNEGGGIAAGRELVTTGSIVWGNAAPDLACEEPATSGGYNLFGDPDTCEIGGDTDLDQVGVDPLLGPLGDNGGPTESHLPLVGSPAIDGGNPAGCLGPDGAALATDQRGRPRPVGVCDVGAVEVQ